MFRAQTACRSYGACLLKKMPSDYKHLALTGRNLAELVSF